jgi:hypothetical protein
MISRGIRSSGSLAVVALIMLGICRCAKADGSGSSAEEVRQILESGWKSSPENYDAARQHYELGKTAAPGDVRTPYAMALVAMHCYRPKEAGEYLAETIANGKPLLPIRRAKTCLDLREKNKEAAVADLEQLIGLLAAADPSHTDAMESARWLGCIMGYLNGPGQGQLSPDQLAKLGTEIADKLKGPMGDAFTAGANQTGNQYAQFLKQLTQAHQDAKQRNETKLAEARRQNTSALANATEARASVEESYKSFQARYPQEVADNRRELGQIQSDYSFLGTTISQLQTALVAEQQKQTEQQNPNYMSQLNDNLTKARDRERQLETRASNINAWFKRMDAQDRTLSRELKKSQVLEDALTRKDKDLEKTKITENDSSTAALESKVNSLNTYADIDLEQEKARILRTYGPATH